MAAYADTFLVLLLDRVGARFFGEPEQSTVEEISEAWNRVRSRPGRLSSKTSDAWERIHTFTGFCGFVWFVTGAIVGILFLVVPMAGWAGAVAHAAILLTASLAIALSITRLAVHYAAAGAASRHHASALRIRSVALLLKSRSVVAVALATAALLLAGF